MIAHQARFLMIEATREPNLASAVLAVSTRELPGQWEERFGYPTPLAPRACPSLGGGAHAGRPGPSAGAVHLSAIVRLAGKLSQSQRRSLGLPFKKSTRFIRVPGYGVYREVLQRLDVEELARELTVWMASQAGDGKTIRDHLGLIVTLVHTEERAPVAVMANLKGKGHELKTVQKLLRSPEVNLSGAVVTADSLHCQDQTAHLITQEKGGDYVLQVRANQPTLQTYAQGQLAGAPPLFRPPTAATGDRNCAN